MATHRSSDGHPGRRRWLGRLRHLWVERGFLVYLGVVLPIVVAIPVLGGFYREGGFDPVPVVSPRPDDPRPGACLVSAPEPSGSGRPADAAACAAPHWGEVLGYRPVGPVAVARPGTDRAEAVAHFECRWLLAAEDPGPGHDVSWSISDEPWWNPATGVGEHYATCVLHRAPAGEVLPPGRVAAVEPHRAGETITVPMSLFGRSEADRVPVGACLGDGFLDNLVVSFDDPVPAARCEGFRTARVLGYPPLAAPGTPWPGADAVESAAQDACARLPARFRPVEQLVVARPGPEWWAVPGRTPYAACLARTYATP